MASTVIDELITLITFKSDKKSKSTLSNFKTGLIGFRKAALVASAALIGAASAVGLLTVKTSNSLEQQGRFAKSIGVSFSALQELQFANEKVGGSAADMNQGLATLTKTMSSPIPGEYNRNLVLLGVNLKDAQQKGLPATAVFLEVVQAFKGLTAIKQVQLGDKLGLPPSLIRLAQSGLVNVTKSMKRARLIGGVFSDKDVKLSIKFDNTLRDLKTTFKGIFTTVVVSLLPAFTKFVAKMEAFILGNKKLVRGNLKNIILGIGQGFEGIFETIKNVVSATSTFINKFTGSQNPLSSVKEIATGIKIVFSGLVGALVLVNIQFVAIAAAIAAIVLLLPKIKKFGDVVTRSVGKFAKKHGINLVPTTAQKEKLQQELPTNIFSTRQRQIAGLDLTKKQTNLLSGGATTNNVTINVNGAGSPTGVASEVKRLLSLSTAAQVASPGVNRPPVA